MRTGWAAGAVVLLLALLAGAAAIFALDQRNDARQQADVAQARELTLEAEKLIDEDPELSAHLALVALEMFRRADENSVQAEAVLRSAIAADRVITRMGGTAFASAHPDGSRFVTGIWDDPTAVAVRDITTGELLERSSSMPTTEANTWPPSTWERSSTRLPRAGMFAGSALMAAASS